MIDKFTIKTIGEVQIANTRVLLRVDYNVSLQDGKVLDDIRIKHTIPTIKNLLSHNNKIILIAHLGEPDGRDPNFSLEPVVTVLRGFLPGVIINGIDDFESEKSKMFLDQQAAGEIVVLENLRFYKGEKENSEEFARSLASLADVYVNDAFGASHRNHASIVSIPKFLPSYAGLLMAHEINTIDHIVHHPKQPFVAIVGGKKISTKIEFLKSLMDVVDTLLIGGGLANTFLAAGGTTIGLSLHEAQQHEVAREILEYTKEKSKVLLLPSDAVVVNEAGEERVTSIQEVGETDAIVDIGPETEAMFGEHIATAKTILWNGPMGKFEDSRFTRGTDYVFYAITQNKDAISLVGGGDTVTAISKFENIDRITHISTGGGAMMEFIENGTLPGIVALETVSTLQQ